MVGEVYLAVGLSNIGQKSDRLQEKRERRKNRWLQNFVTHFKFYILKYVHWLVTFLNFSGTTEIFEISKKSFSIKPAEMFCLLTKPLQHFIDFVYTQTAYSHLSHSHTCRYPLNRELQNQGSRVTKRQMIQFLEQQSAAQEDIYPWSPNRQGVDLEEASIITSFTHSSSYTFKFDFTVILINSQQVNVIDSHAALPIPLLYFCWLLT